MKRTFLLESTSIVERFADWARVSGRDRFWGVANTGGRLCLLLNTIGPSGYRALLITEADSDDVYLVAGYPGEAESDETTIGTLSDDPGKMLAASVRWMLELAHDYMRLSLTAGDDRLGLLQACVDSARVTQSVAEHVGDAGSAADALILGIAATDSF